RCLAGGAGPGAGGAGTDRRGPARHPRTARRRFRGAGPDRRAGRPGGAGRAWRPDAAGARRGGGGRGPGGGRGRGPRAGPAGGGPRVLVELGAGLLEEADPRDVVVELLPDLPPKAQADMVAGLWEVEHPAVTDLLTALSEHHPDPAVARAARKAAFKARSPSPGPRWTRS